MENDACNFEETSRLYTVTVLLRDGSQRKLDKISQTEVKEGILFMQRKLYQVPSNDSSICCVIPIDIIQEVNMYLE